MQKLVGTAITDRRFREGLLNGGRQRLLAQFGLSDEEIALLLAIHAESLEGFAAELQRRLESQRRFFRPPTAVSRPYPTPIGL